MQEFKDELRAMWRRLSFWVAFIASSVALWWLQLPLEQQADILAVWPSLKLLAPGVSLVAFVVARAAPQKE